MPKVLPIEIVHHLAQSRERGASQPLLFVQPFHARSGSRISHLPIGPHLAQAWIKLNGTPFRPHQSLALSSLRRSEPFALMGDSNATRQTLQLLLMELLLTDPSSTGLIVVPNDALAAILLPKSRHSIAIWGCPFGLPMSALTARRSHVQLPWPRFSW
ncbi:MAG: hypothetical protein HC837_15910 [Chloroflexaceae bacterium]|nr:hypothetical protein [Chloroflexaceae bacterium]